jgi:hypothetical protein
VPQVHDVDLLMNDTEQKISKKKRTMFSRAGDLTCLPSSEAFRVAAKKRTRRRPVLRLKQLIVVFLRRTSS